MKFTSIKTINVKDSYSKKIIKNVKSPNYLMILQ